MNDFFAKKISSLLSHDKSFVGIDVGTSTLKIIQVKTEQERAVLETYGELSTSAYTGGEAGRAMMLEDEKVSQMIVDLKKEAGATAVHGVIAIPLRYTFVTVIEMPHLSDSELSEAIPYEARKYIPIPLADVVLDWWRIPETGKEEGPQKTVSILLAAVQKDVIEKYKRILTDAKIEVSGFEIEIFSAARAVGGRFRSAYMLFDIGALSTKIAIIDQGIIRSVHHIDRASQAFSLAISQSLGIDFKRAEVMKRELGIVSRPESAGVRHTITPLLDSIFDEADRLRTNYRRKSGVTVDKAVLLGGGSLMPGLVDYAIERLGIEVLLANPFAQIEYPAFLQQSLKSIAPSFSIAVGLTLRALQER
ncbi:MAG: type IV pilus assembly protein PilM [Patescibacteria group bacterium]